MIYDINIPEGTKVEYGILLDNADAKIIKSLREKHLPQ